MELYTRTVITQGIDSQAVNSGEDVVLTCEVSYKIFYEEKPREEVKKSLEWRLHGHKVTPSTVSRCWWTRGWS